HVQVGDDGPGMTGEECERAMKRGTRIDESSPGSGLGLAIVRDIASEYEGSITLGKSALGGLAANLVLPAR
ncbi:MAG: histidine kinase, partial [Nitratireductor sp.]|nr:histidine kinase [Nitratireductor sp.]